MIANPNKPNIFQWDSHEDKRTYCTETADNPEMNPVLLNSSICSATHRSFSDHCSSQAMEQKLHSGVCMAVKSELLLIAMLPTYIKKKYKHPLQIPDSRCAPAAPLALAQETAVSQALIQCWSVRMSRKCSRSLKPGWNISTAQHQSIAICNPLSHSLLSLMNSCSKTKEKHYF